ncbi:hypothetical protein BDR26DRAFT_867853 [Obelidium mucronatum]|nr:hypothetical protein BDR26DRAFT_867853 [Obelidium mucronatum]
MDNRTISLLEDIQSDIFLFKSQQETEFRKLSSSLNGIDSRLTALESTLADTTTAAISSHTKSLRKEISATCLHTLCRLNTLSSQMQLVNNSIQKFHTSLNSTPDEIITQIFSWIDSCHVFKFRRLNKRVDSILKTAHFAVLNQTKYDQLIKEELQDCLEDDVAELGHGFSGVFALAPSAFQDVYFRRYNPLLKSICSKISWDFTSFNESDSEWKPDFSPFLCRFDGVQELCISRVRGLVPKEFSRFILLEKLEIRGSEMAVISSEICGLPNLSNLSIFGCYVTEDLPKELANLVSLKALCLEGNRLPGCLPTNLGDLRNLVVLSLCGNGLFGELPESIGNLTSLKCMNLSLNRFTGAIPKTVGNMKCLETMDMKFNDFTGLLPSELQHLPRLSSCDFRRNPNLVCNFELRCVCLK